MMKGHHMHDDPTTSRDFICEHCSKSFRRFPSDIRKAAQTGSTIRFCSRACYNAGVRNDVELTCPECGETFTRWYADLTTAKKRKQRMYCSATCRDAASARSRVNRVETFCAACGKAMSVIPARADGRRLYCSYACMGSQASSWTRHGWGRAGIRPDLGHFVRSRWEANICRVLRALSIPYQYEPRTFRCGEVSYTPDLLIGESWIEIKGWMSPTAAAKIAAFREHYPGERLTIIGHAEYAAIRKEWESRIPAWES